jgi:hypothetical protein
MKNKKIKQFLPLSTKPQPPLGEFYQTELEFLKRLWGLGTGEEEGYRTCPPGYICWRNSFLGIDSGAPYTFKIPAQEGPQDRRFAGNRSTRITNVLPFSIT